MPARRNNRVAPFEVMGRAQRRAGAGNGAGDGDEAPRRPAAEPEAAVPGEGPVAQLWDWLRGGSAPLTLRVPRGVAAAALGGVLGLVVLAFWVGYAQGIDAGEAQVQQRLQQQRQAANRSAPDRYANMAPGQGSGEQTSLVAGDDGGSEATADDQPGGGSDSGGDAAQSTGSNPGQAGSGDGDLREVGLNYMILAHYPESAARKLARFVEQQGVATLVKPSDNGRFLVIAVERGFEGSQLGSQATADYRDRLERIGRAWRQHNGGQGDALGSMYFQKYTGP